MYIDSGRATPLLKSFVNSKAQVIPLKGVRSRWVLTLSLALPLAGMTEEVQQQAPVQPLRVDMAVAMAIQ